MSNLYNSYACDSDIPMDNIISPEIIKGECISGVYKRKLLHGEYDDVIEQSANFGSDCEGLLDVFETSLHNYNGSNNWNRKVSIAAVGQMACKLARILNKTLEEWDDTMVSDHVLEQHIYPRVRKATQYEKDIGCIKKNINMALKLNGVNSLTTEDLKSPENLRRKLRAAGVVARETVNLTIGDKNLS